MTLPDSTQSSSRRIYNSVSMMCVDFLDLQNELARFKRFEVDYLHIDIMDGHYVPNVALGSDFCRQLKFASNIPLDMHFMVEDIDRFLPYFDVSGSLVSFHPETSKHPLRTISSIREKKGTPGIAIDPAYTVEQFKYLYEYVDFILIMSVNPGYAGQKLIPSALEKTKALKRYLIDTGCEGVFIELDGNVSWENIPLMVSAGADILVTGTSSIFAKDLLRETALHKFNMMREQLNI